MTTGTPANETGMDMGSLPMDEQNTIVLTEEERDTLGEISNICMGTCATTLSSLLGRRVVITTPMVSISHGTEFMKEYEKPVVATGVEYTQGLDGQNVFLLKKEDAILITDLLLGGGQSEEDLEEMHLSAISEVMNQMVGGSSTALADILGVSINISPPTTQEFTREDDWTGALFPDEDLIRISFRMEIEDLLVSNIMQFMPFKFGKNLAISLLSGNTPEAPVVAPVSAPAPVMPPPRPAAPPVQAEAPVPPPRVTAPPVYVEEQEKRQPVKISTAQFEHFGDSAGGSYQSSAQQKNMDLIIDVPLNVTVVLGKAKKSIREVLDLNLGSVIVLDRLAGEMVDVMVNGKMFARGEVVVIDDNYGVRITEVIAPGRVQM